MPSLLLIIQTSLLLLCAMCAVISWRAASASSRPRKQMLEVQREIGELHSAILSQAESLKRLRSAEGMRDLRDARAKARAAAAPGAPPVPARQETKAEARARIFGAAAGPAFAKRQLEHEREAHMQTS